jgi:hypothetical protein
MQRMHCIQLQIQFQNIHSRLSQESPLPPFAMLRHQSAQIALTHSALPRHTRNLKFRRRRRNMRIEPRSRTSNQIRRNPRPRIFRLEPLHVAIHSRNQRRIRRPQIGSSSTRRIRIISSRPRSRRPRMKISRRSKRLPNQTRSHHLPAQVNDFSIRLPRKRPLRQQSHRQRIQNPQQHSRRQRHPNRNQQILFHHLNAPRPFPCV